MAVVLPQKSRATGRPNGRWAVQYFALIADPPAGERPVLYVGKRSKADARNIAHHVDQLAVARAGKHAAPRETLAWLETIDAELRDKLVTHGLITPREDERAVPLKKLWDTYIAKRKDLKERTRKNLEQARDKQVRHFGEDRDARLITPGEAGDWRLWLQTDGRGRDRGLSRSTIATHVKKARQVFDDAVRRRLLESNPFKQVKAGKQSNDSRKQYIPAADIRAVIAKCPTLEWAGLFALARFAGLRVPSEPYRLEWEDVDFDAGRMIVHSPKTEHHEGKEERVVPIFPELRPHLEALRAAAPASARYVLGGRLPTNPRTTAEKIIARAKLEPWPRLFQNLRSSCQTDLTRKFSQHVACAWLGNTEAVAAKHYLQVTDEDFAKAAGLHSRLHSSHDATTGNCTPPDASKTPIPVGTGVSEYPQGGSKPRKKCLENQAELKTAQRITLQNGESAEQSPENAAQAYFDAPGLARLQPPSTAEAVAAEGGGRG